MMSHPIISEGVSLRVVKSLPPEERALIFHSNNVKKLATAVAERMGFDPFEIRIVRFAAKLHDVAKFLPMYQPLFFGHRRKFSDAERRLANTHAYASALKVLELSSLYPIESFEVVAPGLAMIGGHHWRFDESESRYRSFLDQGQFAAFIRECVNREEIPLLGARILKVVDVFLARTENRDYLCDDRPLTYRESYSNLVDGAGGEFDPLVVKWLPAAFTAVRPRVTRREML